MNKESKQSSNTSNFLLNSNEIHYNFDVVIMGNYEKQETIFLNAFPIEDITPSNTKHRHKYLNRCNLVLRETIKFPAHFKIEYQTELMDKLKNIDILILVYTRTDELSFEYLKTFYYLYYLKMEEKNRPKNIFVMERDYSSVNAINNWVKVDVNSAKNLTKLFNGNFYDYKTNVDDLNLILKEELEKLLIKYDYNDDYNLFRSKRNDNKVDCLMHLYGDKESQKNFMKLLLSSKCDFEFYKRYNDNLYEVIYSIIINGNTIKYQLVLKLVNIEYYYDSE